MAKEGKKRAAAELVSLWECFSDVPGPREESGKRHPLRAILALAASSGELRRAPASSGELRRAPASRGHAVGGQEPVRGRPVRPGTGGRVRPGVGVRPGVLGFTRGAPPHSPCGARRYGVFRAPDREAFEASIRRTSAGSDFGGLSRAVEPCFRLVWERTVHGKGGGKTTAEAVFGITSLTRAEAGAGRRPKVVRHHGSVESLFHVRAVTLGEDACRAGPDDAPFIPSAPRNTVVTPLDQDGATASNLAAAPRRHAAHPAEAIARVRGHG